MSMQRIDRCLRQIEWLAGALLVCAVSPGAFAGGTDTLTLERSSARTAGADANWPLNGGNFESWHFSALSQVRTRNVTRLGLAWSIDLDSPDGLATEPIAKDGTIYLSGTPDRVFAIDAGSGKLLWQYVFHLDLSNTLGGAWAYRVNRGVAVWKGRVFIGTGACRMAALSADSGTLLWQTEICDPRQTGITGAPTVAGGRVFIGYGGSDAATRGSLVALDANTGRIDWRFWNVPGDPAKGYVNRTLARAAKTWSGRDWWRAGGGAAWDSIVYDPHTRLVIYGTAGAGTGLGGSLTTSGDRLFSDCIVALKADTGQYAWSYPTWKLAPPGTASPENFQLVIADVRINGMARRVIMTVPRWGGFVVLDAKSGSLISSKGLADAVSTQLPGAVGGETSQVHLSANWFPMSFNPHTGLAYLPVYQQPFQPPQFAGVSIAEGLLGSAVAAQPAEDFDILHGALGRLIAWDPSGRKIRWSVAHPLAINGGVLSTAGNLVFEGEGTGVFSAYSATTGKRLWAFATGSAIDGTPIAYAIKGKEYILVPVGLGSGMRLFSSNSRMATPQTKRGPSRLLAFALDATTRYRFPDDIVPAVPLPPAQTASAAVVNRGQALLMKFGCWICHGGPYLDGAGAWDTHGAVPDLRYMPSDVHDQFYAIVLGGTHRANGMPGFADGQAIWPLDVQMTVDEARAIHAYIVSLQWKAYREDQGRPDKRSARR